MDGSENSDHLGSILGAGVGVIALVALVALTATATIKSRQAQQLEPTTDLNSIADDFGHFTTPAQLLRMGVGRGTRKVADVDQTSPMNTYVYEYPSKSGSDYWLRPPTSSAAQSLRTEVTQRPLSNYEDFYRCLHGKPPPEA